MSVMVWNYMGLRSTLTVPYQTDINRKSKPDMKFLIETKIEEEFCEMVRRKVKWRNEITLHQTVCRGAWLSGEGRRSTSQYITKGKT